MTHWMVAVALIAGAPEPPVTPVYTTEAVQELGPMLETGSLIFSKGDCMAIKVFSVSNYTHVAAVVVRDDAPMVYDSTGGAGVRRLPLADYLATQGTAPLYVLQPRKAFSAEQARRFEAHLESQLGRPYSVAHHLTGQRVDGIHCAEYLTDALAECELVKAKNPPRVSPASLRSGLIKSELYDPIATVQLVEPIRPVPAATTWCGRMWESTCVCTANCWRKLRGCVLCY
jgi:hypothetical protein